MKPLIAVLLAVWLASVLVLGATEGFVTPAGTAPLPIGLGAVVPVLVFLAAFWGSASFRALVMTADLPLLTAMQAWRFAGLGFLALHAYRVLPGDFTWSAGLGDIALGLTAPWVALALVRRPGFAGSWLFVVWNLLGMLDLVAAVTLGARNRILATGAAGEVTTGPMAGDAPGADPGLPRAPVLHVPPDVVVPGTACGPRRSLGGTDPGFRHRLIMRRRRAVSSPRYSRPWVVTS